MIRKLLSEYVVGPGRTSEYDEPIYVDPVVLAHLPELAPGVVGFASRQDGVLHVGLVIAREQGSGDVGRYLDSLTGPIIVDNVRSDRLAGMLERRGFARVCKTADWCRG